MFESLYPADDIWEKFDIPPMTLFPEVSGVEGSLEPPRVVPSHVMGGRHDCMWAGTCSSGQHQRQCCEPEHEPEPVVAVTVTLRRSLLRTNRNRARSKSPRPETPSESEEEECSSVFSSVCDQEDLSVAVSVSEVTGQISRTKCETKSVSPVPPQSPVPSYYTDHSYHLSKTAVTLENLGVQTPSDSEEEIDVVSVVDREKLTTLPTNPSARDRQQLQLTVASAIKQRSSRSRKRNVVVAQTAAPTTTTTTAVAATTTTTEVEEKRPHKRRRARDEGGVYNDKRREHNDMERQRRIDLRDCTVNLRMLIPSIEHNERAAKVLILREATKHCRFLNSEYKELCRVRAALVQKQSRLTQHVRELRFQHARIRKSTTVKSPRKKRMGSRSKRRKLRRLPMKKKRTNSWNRPSIRGNHGITRVIRGDPRARKTRI